MMNKKQYFRLTLVLVIPVILLSWWLSQQDFIFERGQQITCNVEQNNCNSVFSFPLKEYSAVNNTNLLKYLTHDGETLIFLTDFKYPIEPAYFIDSETNQKVIDPDANPYLTASMLETMGCSINSFNFYSCKDISGRFSFKNENDAKNFNNLILVAKEEFKKADTIRLGIAFLFFLGIFCGYFTLSFIIKFIMYGFKK